MKAKLKLGFTDTIESVANFFIEVLSIDYDIERNDAAPDYLIFGDRNFGVRNENYDINRCIKIFYTGENQRPWDYKCHYAISFDHYDTDNHYRLPLYVIYDHDNKKRNISNSGTFKRDCFKLFQSDRKFCSFIVKNGSCKRRNDFFHRLSEYRQVDSAGPLFNNIGYVLEGGANACHAKLDFLPKYKFNLCYENASHPGYVTEKLYEAFMGDTIPIYWGSPTVEVDFNPKAFLNWHDYQDDDLFLEAIKAVDMDDQKYIEMYAEPIFANKSDLPNKFFDMDRFRRWFKNHVYMGELKR